MKRLSFDLRSSRPRSVWFALGTGIAGCLAVVVLILMPVLGLIGSAISFAPLLTVPWLQIIVTVVAGYLLAAGCLALIVVCRNGALAWILTVAAVVSALIVSVYPVVAVALSAAQGVGEVIPIILGWIEQAQSTIGR